MVGKYPVIFKNQRVGHAEITKCGMYYMVHCVCMMKPEIHHRIEIICADNRLDLGICVPGKDCLELRTRIPVKYLGEGIPSFQITQQEENGRWYEISKENACEILPLISNAVYCVKEGIPGLHIITPE